MRVMHELGARDGCTSWVHESRGARDGCTSTSDEREVHKYERCTVHLDAMHLESTF